MIPLIRPNIPKPGVWAPFLEETYRKGQFTNFGHNYFKCVEDLRRITGRYCVPVTNGTAAITLAVKLLRAKGYDETVYVPDFTHAGSFLGASNAGALSIAIAPVSEKTWTIDRDKIAPLPGSIIIVVSPFGYGVDIPRFERWAEEKEVALVYDFAGGFGIDVKSTKWPVCHSFHSTKNLPIGEGGVVSMKDEFHADLIRRMSNFENDLNRNILSDWGENSKMDEFRCSILRAQLAYGMRNYENRHVKNSMLINLYAKEFNLKHGVLSGSRPSLCVLGHDRLDGRDLEREFMIYDITVKKYYIPLTEMSGLSQYSFGLKSPKLFSNCFAFPTDVSDKELECILETGRKILR